MSKALSKTSTARAAQRTTTARPRAAIAAELLTICQSITEDGRIQKDEIKALRDWLRLNRRGDLPAIGFLCEIVARIIADKVVTAAEQAELYHAIEKVLPKEARATATKARKKLAVAKPPKPIGKGSAGANTKRGQSRPKPEQRDDDGLVWKSNFLVAGVHNENRQKIVHENLEVGEVRLVRDRKNRYSPNAIQVSLKNGMVIGFVPEAEAVKAAPLLDRGLKHRARVVKILRGSQVPIPIVEAAIYGLNARLN